MSSLRRLFELSCLTVALSSCAETAVTVPADVSSVSPTLATETTTYTRTEAHTSDQSGDASCPVTAPNGKTPPGESPSELDYGNENDTMWIALWPDGIVIFTPSGPGSINPDGSLSMKWGWYWSGGPLTSIEGRRLDGDALPLRAEIGETTVLPFSPSTLTFPTEGCWEVTGRTDNDSLTFVTVVVKQES